MQKVLLFTNSIMVVLIKIKNLLFQAIYDSLHYRNKKSVAKVVLAKVSAVLFKLN
jgi:hypothetical protein